MYEGCLVAMRCSPRLSPMVVIAVELGGGCIGQKEETSISSGNPLFEEDLWLVFTRSLVHIFASLVHCCVVGSLLFQTRATRQCNNAQ